MKILFISTDFPYNAGEGTLTQGGGGACVAQLAEALDEKGVDISVITRREPQLKREIYAFPIHRTDFYYLGFRESKITHVIPATQKCISLLKKEKFDLIHSHNPVAGMTGVLASKNFSMKHVMTLHGPWAGVRQRVYTRMLARAIECSAVRFTDFVTCDSSALQKEVIETYNTIESKTKAIPNAVDANFFNPKKSSEDAARKKLGIKTKDKLIFYTGRFVEEKGLPYLLEAYKLLSGEEKDVSLLLLGGGFDEHLVGEWLERNSSLRKKITVIPYLPYHNMPYAYIASDIFVLPTLAEGMSRSIMEAMACGKPVVATNVGGNPELVSKDRGLLVEPKNILPLKDAIQNLLTEERLCVSMGKRGREFVVKNLSVEKRLESFLNVYDKLTQ